MDGPLSVASSRRRSHTAETNSTACSSLVVTHPFHPLVGQRLTVLHERRLTALGRVFICDAGERGTLALPPDFTDRVGDSVGCGPLDLRVLAELARILGALEGR